MSLIIEMPDSDEPTPCQDLKRKLNLLFRSKMFQFKNIEQKANQITFWIRGNQNFYPLSTCWRFILHDRHLIAEVCLYGHNGEDFLRVQTDRMKIQLAILLGIVNGHLRMVAPTVGFLVDTGSGVLKVVDWLPITDEEMDKEKLFKPIDQIFAALKRFDQIPKFLQPLYKAEQLSLQQQQDHPIARLNRLRCLLLNTPSRRKVLEHQTHSLANYKFMNLQFSAEFQILANAYMTNIVDFKLSQLGLQGIDYTVSKKQFKWELKKKEENQMAIVAETDKERDKILFGLVKIQQSKKVDQDAECEKDKPEGGHSSIQSKRFEYYIAETIHSATINEFLQKQPKHPAKKREGYLTFKTCNTDLQVAINSFKNQLAFLRHVRDMANPFIARYYLLIKQKWDQKDTIYMTTYKKNVYQLITGHSMMDLRGRIDVAYKIAKGLCFMFAREILHRDFKPQNVVVDSYLTPRLIDFGSCISHFKGGSHEKKFQTFEQRLISTPSYQIYWKDAIVKMPGLLHKYQNNRKRFDEHPLFDVYSFGRTLSFIFFGKLAPPVPESQNFAPPYGHFYQNLIFLIEMCLQIDPDDRPSFGEITTFLGVLGKLLEINNKQQQTRQNPKSSQKEDDKKQNTEQQRPDRTKTSKKQQQKSEKHSHERKADKKISQKSHRNHK